MNLYLAITLYTLGIFMIGLIFGLNIMKYYKDNGEEGFFPENI